MGAAAAKPTGLLIWSYICAAVALAFLPPLFGGLAIFLGSRANKRLPGSGLTAMIVGGIATVVGMVIGAAVFLS